MGSGTTIGKGNGDSARAMRACTGKRIAALALRDEALCIEFADGTRLRLADEGQDCCERRYMRTDDDLGGYVGGELLGAEVRDAPMAAHDDDCCHEVQFLVVHTSKGDLTMSSHNEHNGYYGGFCIRARVEG